MDNKEKLLVFMAKNMDREMSLLEISKESKVPYTTLRREYEKVKNLFEEKKIGKSIIIKLKKKKIVKNYLIVASYEEAQEFLKKNKLFSKITEELPKGDYCLLLFGSYAKGEERNSSDIDFLIINKDGSKNISFSKYEAIFKVEINPIFVSVKEFRQMLEDKEENVGKQAIKNHIILYNQELFWNEVFKNGI